MTFKQLAARLNATGGPITGRAALMPRGGGDAFAVQIVDVEVDPETGKVQVLRCTAIEDVGQAGHRAYVEGQIQGAMAQGIGWALSEEYDFDDSGAMRNNSFLDYRMPTTTDLPMIDTVLLEFPSPNHPFGIKGVGELPIVPPMPAVANAVAHAAGVRLQVAPMTPTRVLEAMLQEDSLKSSAGS
jgi:xanthine dehydrogenase molybdenum-binding subunit